MRLTVELDELTRAGGATRADVESVLGENKVNSLYLLFFDDSSDGSGTFRAYTEVDMPEPDPVTNPDGNYSMNLDATFEFPDGTTSGGSYSILAIANIADNVYIDKTVEAWMAQWTGRTESYFISNAVANIPEGNFSPSFLLMHGSQRKPAGDDQVHMLLKRDVSRFDVTKASTFTGWEIASVSVWNSFPRTYIGELGIMDFTGNTERVRRHYGISSNTEDGNIRGGLYAFENQVGKPEDNDVISTCLIIGLQPTAGGAIEYFRVNMHNDTGAQLLRRNYVYNLLIQGKTGTGAKTEEIAYLGQSNKLIYAIDDWGEDDPTDLVARDEYSTLAIPTKTVIMGQNASVAEYRIHTFSTLPSPAPLRIRSQTYTPASITGGFAEGNGSPIWARLDGNTLVVESKDAGFEEERNGVIVLSYAGLEISMNVSQSGSHDNFLIVTEPDGGILPFAAYAGIPSGLIRVQASGHWTAKLYMTGFSFDSSQATDAVKMIWTNPASPGDADYLFTDGRGYNNSTGLIIPDEIDSAIDKFRVYTHSHNLGQEPREAFIIVELDGMEDQYSAVIMLNQNYVKNLHYAHSASDPSDPANRTSTGGSITFDGMGQVPTTGSYAGNNNWWYVFSGYDEGTTNILPWTAVMAIAGGADDRSHFEIVRNVDEDGVAIPVGDPKYDANATQYSASDVALNKVKIKAKGMNTSGRDYKVTLRVQTDPGTFADIDVVQQSASFELSPSGLLQNKVTYMGGSSDPVSVLVSGGDGLKWKIASASDISFSEAPAGDHTRSLVHYGEFKPESGRANEPITLVIVDENGNPTSDKFAFGQEYDLNKSFRVKMPKIYFPNRDIAVTAAVTVTVNSAGATSGGIKQTVRVAQNPLSARTFVARQNTVATYNDRGTIRENDYSKDWKDMIDYIITHSVYGNGVKVTANTTGPYDATVNYLNRTNQGMDASTSWTATHDFLDNNDGVFSFIADYPGAAITTAMNRLGRGWVFDAQPAHSANGYTDAGLSETKIWEFVANRTGGTVLPTDLATAYTNLNYHDTSSTWATTIPSSAVPFIRVEQGHVGIAIDPKTRIIYIGESLYVGTGSASRNATQLWINVGFYVNYASRYGSGFSDLLIDDESAAGGGLPAPWDDWWGANKITSFDNSYGK